LSKTNNRTIGDCIRAAVHAAQDFSCYRDYPFPTFSFPPTLLLSFPPCCTVSYDAMKVFCSSSVADLLFETFLETIIAGSR
jgi:hypothetical protein